MLYPLSYRGTNFFGSGMLARQRLIWSTGFPLHRAFEINMKRDRRNQAISFSIATVLELGCARLVLGRFREHPTTIKGVVNYLANGRGFWVNVHSVTRFQMSDNSFSRDLQSYTCQFGIASRLNVIDSK
jgi:hypothetical protein